jgi:hypothetical protein
MPESRKGKSTRIIVLTVCAPAKSLLQVLAENDPEEAQVSTGWAGAGDGDCA